MQYVKTVISVVSMGFLRGLSAAHMETIPAINDWVAHPIAKDPVLSATGLRVIRNRHQLRANRQMADLADPSAALHLVGELSRPLPQTQAAMPTLLRTSSLRWTLATCVLAVPAEMKSAAPISALVIPFATSRAISLPVRQRVQRLRGPGSAGVPVAPQQADREGGADQGVARHRGAHRLHQQRRARALQQEAAGAVAQRGVDVFVESEGRHHHHAHRALGVGPGESPGDLQAVHARHADVGEYDVRAQFRGEFDGPQTVGGLADHFHVGLGIQDESESDAYGFLVVGEEYASGHDRHRSSRSPCPASGTLRAGFRGLPGRAMALGARAVRQLESTVARSPEQLSTGRIPAM